VESKAYLREYNVVGVRWCIYSCNCTRIYISKLNTIGGACTAVTVHEFISVN
jgi:hypothetical protein